MERYPVLCSNVHNCEQKIDEATQVCNCDSVSAVEVTDCPNSLLHDSQLGSDGSKSEKFALTINSTTLFGMKSQSKMIIKLIHMLQCKMFHAFLYET